MTKEEEEAYYKEKEERYKKLCPLFNGICRKNNCVFWNEDIEECNIQIKY
jgi:hypothetical protein